MNIYFSGSIYGGRQKLEEYKKLINALSNFGKVLNEEVADDDILITEKENSADMTYESLMERLKKSDFVFAEITVPSLGVGYEIGYADKMNKKIICVYDKTITPEVTTMLRGNNRLKIIPYENIEEIINNLDNIIREEIKWQ